MESMLKLQTLRTIDFLLELSWEIQHVTKKSNIIIQGFSSYLAKANYLSIASRGTRFEELITQHNNNNKSFINMVIWAIRGISFDCLVEVVSNGRLWWQ